nr:UBN2 domain-containing protein [Tanacetum cinerariifolium]
IRALPLKWRARVTAIEEAKDLATLPLDELIGNHKVYEMILDNDGVASKTTKQKVKPLALKAKVTREQTSDDSDSQGDSDEDVAIDLVMVPTSLEEATEIALETKVCKILAVPSHFFWQWQQSSLAVGTYNASGNSNMAVGMPCAFYSQQSSPKLDAPFAFKFSRIK